MQRFLDAVSIAGGIAAVLLVAFVVYLAQAELDQRRSALAGLGRLLANLLLLLWVLATWRRATRNLGLAYPDKHAIKRVRRTDQKGVVTEREQPKVTYPWMLPRLDAYGLVLTVWTRVGVGREQWEKAAEHLANSWRCRRVQVSQHRPGRITVRALRRDPLSARLSLHVVPEPYQDERSSDDAEATYPPQAV